MLKWYSWIPRILQTVAWLPTRLILHYFCHFTVSGKEHLKGLNQAIFAVNHASELDPIILTAALSPIGRFSPMFYIAAPEDSFNHEKFGWRRYLYGKLFFKSWGAYPTPAGLHNYARTLANHVVLLHDGSSLCVFPEGRMTLDGSLQRGHGGVAYLAHISRVPVVPVYISGTFGMNRRKMFKGKETIAVRFGRPMSSNEILSDSPNPAIEDYKTGAQAVMERISTLISIPRDDATISA